MLYFSAILRSDPDKVYTEDFKSKIDLLIEIEDNDEYPPGEYSIWLDDGTIGKKVSTYHKGH